MENGFMLWDLKGDLVSKQNQPRFTAFAWRPRPRILLSRQQVKEIKKNMKTLAVKYEVEDAQSMEQTNSNASESKKKMMEEWVLYRVKTQTALEAKAKLRESILKISAVTSESDSKIVQEWIEDEVIEETEEELKE